VSNAQRSKPAKSAGEFGDEVKEIRKLLGLTQQALAVRLNCHLRTIQTWEGGEKLPHPIIQQRIRSMRRAVPQSERQRG